MRKVILVVLAMLLAAPALARTSNSGPDYQGGKENGRRDHGHGHP